MLLWYYFAIRMLDYKVRIGDIMKQVRLDFSFFLVIEKCNGRKKN